MEGKRTNKAWSSGGYMVSRARTIILRRQLVSFSLLRTTTRISHIELCVNHCHILVNIELTFYVSKNVITSEEGVKRCLRK
jgi:hypothetical protein